MYYNTTHVHFVKGPLSKFLFFFFFYIHCCTIWILNKRTQEVFVPQIIHKNVTNDAAVFLQFCMTNKGNLVRWADTMFCSWNVYQCVPTYAGLFTVEVRLFTNWLQEARLWEDTPAGPSLSMFTLCITNISSALRCVIGLLFKKSHC